MAYYKIYDINKNFVEEGEFTNEEIRHKVMHEDMVAIRK
jgi:hypothetical protein